MLPMTCSRFRSLMAVCAASAIASAAPPAAAITMDMVTVGDAGNAADTTGYGVVTYRYGIGKYEVTIEQYAEFLNAVAATDTNKLYSSNMTIDLRVAGIERTGLPGSYHYNVVGPFGGTQIPQATAASRPITYVCWFDAARFANWMSNGQPKGAQGLSTTENGAYDLSSWLSGTCPAANTINPYTGMSPLYRLPTQDEWYKAAYYKGGSSNAGYWLYPTQSDSEPGNVPGSSANQANYAYAGSVLCVTRSGSVSSDQNYLTDVGAFTASPSPYGTFDQGGNVLELNDLTGAAGVNRGGRGGDWNFPSNSMLTDGGYYLGIQPLWQNWLTGFRLAGPVDVPTPIKISIVSETQTQGEVGYVTLSGSIPVMKTGDGTLVLNQTNTLTGFMTVQGGVLRLAHGSALSSSRLVVVAGGTGQVSPGTATGVASLDLATGNGLVDLTSGALTISSGMTATALVAEVLTGRGDGSWNGTSGITSSVASASVATSTPRAVGWLDNGDGSLKVAYAASGDTNLDWAVDILDASNFLSFGKFDTALPSSWTEGDFSYDGIVDILDAADFFATGLYDSGVYNLASGGIAPVPEPSTCAMALAGLACGGYSLFRRRRTR